MSYPIVLGTYASAPLLRLSSRCTSLLVLITLNPYTEGPEERGIWVTKVRRASSSLQAWATLPSCGKSHAHHTDIMITGVPWHRHQR